MSTLEDREWDAERDARTACDECAAQGFGTSLADCPGHDDPEAPILCTHHEQLLHAVDANSTGVDLDHLAASFARGCGKCQEA